MTCRYCGADAAGDCCGMVLCVDCGERHWIEDHWDEPDRKPERESDAA